MLEVPVRTRCAECNGSLDAIKARIEKHFEPCGTAQRNAIEVNDAPKINRKPVIPAKKRRGLRRLQEKTEVVVKQSARERMQRFSRHLEERLKKKAQRKPRVHEPLPVTTEEEDTYPEAADDVRSLSPICEERRAEVVLEKAPVAKAVAKRVPLLRNPRLVESLQCKLEARGVVLPPLCACGHGIDALDVEYTRHCCVNCGLYGNERLHGQLLKHLLQSYLLA